MNCIVCDNNNFVKESHFTRTCVVCKLEIANLKNRFGAEVKGIYELRNKNFKKIISQILTIKKKTKYSRNWFRRWDVCLYASKKQNKYKRY